MTVALEQRWWAPEAPGIGPDEFDLSLLQPGSEPAKDLGSHLLALHRVGAAACEAVATQPLADEVTLRGVLATARQMLAEPAVSAVSKAVDDERYGALLLRDFLDDAEQAAVSIYRTCITKQMAPSMAAHRVGLVYGVPLRELGRYTMLATDPKANKDAVLELADRTLFGFVAKVLAEEGIEERKVTVSKAPAGERERPRTQADQLQALFDRAESTYLDEHHVVNDPATGQFVSEGTTTTPVGRRTLSRPTLARRSLARRDLRRPTAAEASEPGRLAQGSVARGKLAQGRLKQGQLTRGQRRLASLLPEIEVPPTTLGTGRDAEGDTPDYLSRVPDDNDPALYEPLQTEMSFVFTGDEWNDRKRGMAQLRDADTGTQQLMFRARALHDGGPYLEDDPEGHRRGMHAEAREHLVSLLRERPEHKNQPPPIIKKVFGAAESIRDRGEVAAQKTAFIKELEQKLGRRLNSSTEMTFIQAAVDHDDPDNMVLVWQPPTPGRQPLDRPVQLVTEVIIDAEDAHGMVSGRSRHGSDIQVDENQPLKVLGATSYWHADDPHDPDSGGYFINQLEASEAYDEDLDALAKDRERRRKKGFRKGLVAKAVNERSAEQLQQLQALFDQSESRYLEEHHVTNDAATGQFVSQSGPKQLSRAKLSRAKLARRNLAPARLRQGAPAKLRQGELAQGSLATGMLTKGQLEQAALAAEEGQNDQTVFLDDGFHYAVLDLSQVGLLLDEANLRYLEESYEKTFVPGLRSAAMITNNAVGAREARMELLTEAELRFRDADGANWKQLGDSYLIDNEDEMRHVALDIEDQLGRDPKVQMLRSVIHKRDDGKIVVTVHGNVHDMRDGHLVRMDNDITTPIRLRPEEPRRLMDRVGIERWLRLRFHGHRHVGATGSTDYLPVPLVHTWVAEDHYDAP